MCEQCQAIDDEDDLDTLAAAFLARHGKVGSPKPEQHALLNGKADRLPVATVKPEAQR